MEESMDSNPTATGPTVPRRTVKYLALTTAAIWGIAPLLLSAYWLLIHVIMSGFGGLNQSFTLDMTSAANTRGPLFWAWVLVCALFTLGIFIYAWVDDLGKAGYESRRRSRNSATSTVVDRFGIVVVALIILGASFQVVHLNWQNSLNSARFYDTNTVVYTPSLTNYPSALNDLLGGAKKGTNGCAFVASSDVPSCIKVGSMSTAGFAPRVSSLAAAITVMQATSGQRQNVDLLTNTVTYLNGTGTTGVWSGVRDGTGAFQPTEGVVTWNGIGSDVKECFFNKSAHDNFDKAISGVRSNSLVNYLTNLYPNLYWQSGDVWGYCNDSHPVLVFPVSKQVHYLNQVVSSPAGVLVVTGSTSGKPSVSYETHASNLPGPVYPISIATNQLQGVNWLAGRAKHDRALFGFEPANSPAQNGNVENYLLKSLSNGHTYWVTPLTLVNSQSQLFVAYALVRADEVSAGHLNTMSVYVLDPKDTRSLNIDTLDASAREYLSNNDPGFFTSGGTLGEFTPAKGDYWRAYGEINGRVEYLLDISANANESPSLVALPSAGSGNTPTTIKNDADQMQVCGNPLNHLTVAQKVACAQFFVNNLPKNGL
jgi:hypothetical protein